MKEVYAILALLVSLAVEAAPAGGLVELQTTSETANADAIHKRGGPRFSCGQYKFDDGTVQEFYSQVWAGIPADRMVCRYLKYEFGNKKGQEGTMVAAKVDLGCTCFFYE